MSQPGIRYFSKNGPISVTPAALAMCGRPTEAASPAWAIAPSSVTSTPAALRLATISSARLTRSCWALSQVARIFSVSIQ